MNRFDFIPTSSRLSIEVDNSIDRLRSDSSTDVEWESLKITKKNLFDGKILYFLESHGSKLMTFEGDYKHWCVNYHRPVDKRDISISAMAVTGIIRNGNHILVGKRSSSVSQNKGFFDLLPSGSLDINSKGDFLLQLESEYREELHSEGESNYTANVLGVLVDRVDCVVDVVVEMNVEGDLADFQLKNNEYEKLKIINSKSDLEIFEFSESAKFLLKILYR